MSQNYTDDVYAASHNGQTDLQNIENNFAALKSSFSGATAPSNVVGGQVWHNGNGRYVRDYANSEWLVSLMGSADFKIWVYRNDTDEGWVVDNTVTDVVCGIKGGSRAFNVLGGTLAGSWTLSGLTMAHTHPGTHVHQWYNQTGGSADDQSYNSGGAAVGLTMTAKGYRQMVIEDGDSDSGPAADYYTTAVSGAEHAASLSVVQSDATWRIRAAVGTLQHPDIAS